VAEKEAQVRVREPLDPADPSHQRTRKPFSPGSPKVQTLPALG
jgi:hypothetical protein